MRITPRSFPYVPSRLWTRILVYAQVQDPPQQGIDIEQFLIFYTGRIRMQLLVYDTEPSANKWRFKILIRVRIPGIKWGWFHPVLIYVLLKSHFEAAVKLLYCTQCTVQWGTVEKLLYSYCEVRLWNCYCTMYVLWNTEVTLLYWQRLNIKQLCSSCLARAGRRRGRWLYRGARTWPSRTRCGSPQPSGTWRSPSLRSCSPPASDPREASASLPYRRSIKTE